MPASEDSPGGIFHDRQTTSLPAAGADPDFRRRGPPGAALRVGLPAHRAERERPRQRLRRPGRRRQERERHLLQPRGPHPGQGLEPRGVRRADRRRRRPSPTRRRPSPRPAPAPFPVPLGSEGGDARQVDPRAERLPVGPGERADLARRRLQRAVRARDQLESPPWMGRFHATKSKVEALQRQPDDRLPGQRRLLDRRRRELAAPEGRPRLGRGLRRRRLLRHRSRPSSRRGSRPATAAADAQRRARPAARPLGRSARRARPSSPATSNAWGWNAGALLKLGEQAHVGRQLPLEDHARRRGHGGPSRACRPSRCPARLAPIGTTLNARFANGPVTTTIELPDTFSVAAAWESEKVEMLADYTYTGWDSIQSLDIEREGATDHFSSVPLQLPEHLARRPRGQRQAERQVHGPPRHRLRQGAGAGRVPHAAAAGRRPHLGRGRLRVEAEPEGDARRRLRAHLRERRLAEQPAEPGHARPRRPPATWWASTTRRSTSWACRSPCTSSSAASRRALRRASRPPGARAAFSSAPGAGGYLAGSLPGSPGRDRRSAASASCQSRIASGSCRAGDSG